jgi:membrane-associated PAP2 superfamily phosphatase
MPPLDHRKAAIALGLLTLAALAVFVVFPGLDLAVSARFHRPGEGFWLAGNPLVDALRHGIWTLSIAVFAFAIAALVLAAFRRPILGVDVREAGFIVLLYLLGPILLVNGVLKEHWGRARPVEVTEFGGTATFTPPWLPSDQCIDNCSFVSGEGSAAMALGLAFLVLAPDAWRLMTRRGFALYALAGTLLPAAGIALRVMTGRHFLSDTVFAVLLVLALALGLHRLLLKGR